MLAENLFPLLQRCQTFSPEYDGGLSLHLPMALTALARMGAQESQLQDLFAAHERQHKLATACDICINDENFHDHLGQIESFIAYQVFFSQQIQDFGADACLRHFLHELMPGIASSAFHALIRLSYALELGKHLSSPPISAVKILHTEFASALATIACRYQPLPSSHSIPKAPQQADIATILRPLHSAKWHEWHSEHTLISSKIASVAKLPEFLDLVHLLKIDEQHPALCLQSLSNFAAQLYLQQKNFTVLHMLTASHAMRIALPYFKDQVCAMRHFWQAYVAAFIASRATDLEFPMHSTTTQEIIDWQQIFRCALTSKNEHKIKLIYTCHEEYHAYQQNVYCALATGLLANA